MGRGSLWVDIARQYGGRSNAIGEVDEQRPEWNQHRCFKLRIKRYAFDQSGHVWVTNNRKFIPLSPKSYWRYAKKRRYQHSIPDWVTDGKRYGFMAGHMPQEQYCIIHWFRHNNNPDTLDYEVGNLTFNEANRMRIHWSAAWKAIGW